MPIRQRNRRVFGFFPTLGMKPVWPESLQTLRDTLSKRQQGGNTIPDLLTTVTLSHKLRMITMIVPDGIEKLNFTEKIERRRLDRHGEDMSRFHKSKYESPLSQNTIGGNDAADPRPSSNDGESLIVIVSNNLQQIDKDDKETLFTASISQHYTHLFSGIDTVFSHSLGDDVVVSEDSHGLDDGMFVEDEDDEGVTNNDDEITKSDGNVNLCLEIMSLCLRLQMRSHGACIFNHGQSWVSIPRIKL